MDEYYKVLELKPDASLEQIKQAYRDLVRVWHPDRFGHDARLRKIAEEKLKEINIAYEVLSRSENIRYQQTSTSNQECQENHTGSKDKEFDSKYTKNQIFSALKFVAFVLAVVVSLGFIFPGVFAVYAFSIAYLHPIFAWIIFPILSLSIVLGILFFIKKMIYGP